MLHNRLCISFLDVQLEELQKLVIRVELESGQIVELVLVVLLLITVIYAGINMNAAEKGDMSAAKRAPMIGGVAMLLLLGVILCAVFTFN